MSVFRFYTCLNGVAYSQTCASTLYFNAYTGKCDRPGDVNFCQGHGAIVETTRPPPITPTFSGSTATTRATTAATVGTQPPAVTAPTTATTRTTASTTTRTTTPTTVKPIETRCIRNAGYFLVAGSCVDYVYCIKGEVRFEFTCSEGTWYDLNYEQCRNVKPDGC